MLERLAKGNSMVPLVAALLIRNNTSMDYTIRPGVADDLPDIEAIVRDAYWQYIARLGREPSPLLDDYGSLVRQGRVSVIEYHGAVQGFLVLIPEVDAMLLDNVAVSSAVRGSGIGRALLEFAEQSAINAGYRKIKLYTNEAMIENLELYRRIGYVETHRGKVKGLHRVYMTKVLPPG